MALLHGADAQLLDDALAAASHALCPDPSAAVFDREVLDGREASAAAAVQSALTLPVLAPMRLVAVRHCQLWPVKGREIVAEYCAGPNPAACLLLLADESLAASRGHKEHWLLGAVPSAAVVALPARARDPLAQWLRRRASAEGLTVSEEAALRLVDWVGDDSAAVLNEVRKAALAGGPQNQSVGLQEVTAVVGERRVSGVFDLTGAVARRDITLGVRALESLLATEQPMRILALLGSEIRMGWTIEEWSRRGQGVEQIARTLGRPLSVVQAHAACAREAPGTAPSWLRRCWEAERRLKSGGDARAELTALVIALCGR